jgi:hypothetical protein
MNNFGSPRSTIHSYTDGVVIQSIGGTQASRMFANGNLILGTGTVDNGYKLEITGNLYVNTIANAITDTDKFLVSDGGVIKYRTGAEILSDIGAQGALTLTTTGTSGPATLISNTLNIPNYGSALTGYVPYSGATQDLDLGTYGLISDFVRFNPSSSNIPSAEGVMSWDNTDGTVRLSVKGNTYSVPIGQSVISRVRNNTGTNLLRTNYQVVKVAGAQGQRLAVTLAQANNDANSASTLGLVCENISNNQEGFIVNIGQIVNVNTTGNLQGETWLDGDVLYLSPTIAGAITKVKPLAPQHTVILGYVEYAHANNGKIYVKIDNGYELEELHDVSAEPFINNGVLYRDTTLNLWKSATISTILGFNPAPQGNYITSLTGEATASGPGAASVTLLNSAVTGKVLTGLNIAGNAIVSTDSILTAFGKLQHQVNQLVGGLQYEGTWNALTNTPTITSSVGTDGTFYIVSVAGTTNINGINDWQVGDWIVFHDTAWQKVDNSDSVSSVFGRVGNIVANQSDYSAFYPLIADIKNGILTVQGTGVLSGSGTFSANQATNNTISLTHNSVSRTDTTSTQTPSFSGSFTVVDSVTSSAEGHVTAINTKTVTVPSTIATSTITGLLSNTDWVIFNSKQNALTLTTTGTSGAATLVGAILNIPQYQAAGTYVTGVTASSPLFSSGGATPNITIQQASGSQSGFLSSTDWTTFNNKANANGSNASGTWSINITGSAGSAGSASTASLVNGTSGGAIQSWDIRTISPSSMTAARLGFGFTSWANNNTSPWADYLHLRSYSDGSGGADNLVMFLKSGIGMRIYQQTFGSGTAYSSFADVLLSTNFSSYALPLTGGTLTGPLTIGTSINSVIWNDGNGTYIENTGNTSSSRKIRLQAHNGSFSYTQLFIDGAGGFVEATNQMRAPIFYDSNNTAFYADFNTTGTSINIAGSINAATFNKPAILVNSSGTSSAGAAFGMQQVTAEGWTGIFVDFEPNTGWGLYHDNPNNFFLFTAETTTGQIGSGFTVPSRSSGNRTAYTKFLVDQTTGDVTVGRVGTAQQDFRAPIFYDSNNTSFYVDPASTSVLNGLTIGGRTALNTAYYLYHSNRDFPSGTLVQTNINYSVSEGDPFILEITGNSYGALIPFDIQVQGYIYANTIINAAGISNGTNISGVRAINFNGNLCFWWPYQSYWQGFNIKVYSAYATYPENRVTSISNSAQPTTSKQYDFAIYQSFHTANTSLFSSYDITFNRASSNTDMRAQIFYDSNNTAYYADPNSTSNFLYSRSYYWWTTYTPLTAPRWDTSFYVLQSQHWYSHSGAGDMYLGESGNHISIRGYSTADGSFRSPIFYDSNDTSYYADPNSTSRFVNLLLGGASASGFNLNITGNAQIVKSSTSTALIVGLSGVTGSVIRFSYNGGFVGSISTDGSNTAYNTSSDYRLKEEIVPIENPVTKILSLNPVNFKYKNSKTRQDGFIAHELQEVLPYMVVGEKDAIDEDGIPVYQEVDYSKLTPILIAAIKELKTELETLKTRL